MSDEFEFVAEPVPSAESVADAAPAATRAPRRWVRQLVAGAVGLVVGVTAVELVLNLPHSDPKPAPKPGAFVSAGSLRLTGAGVPMPGTAPGCSGRGGYADITEGAGVTVYDASGRVVGEGSLPAGAKADLTSCVFPFSVPDVPEGSEHYQVEVAHRGKPTVSAEDAKAGKFAGSPGWDDPPAGVGRQTAGVFLRDQPSRCQAAQVGGEPHAPRRRSHF
ncbi:hypothetical protein ACFC1R_15720 [Kitasatospora sp. NPDC056138]|uniref:hypothetical protein n=1 Tax=Kitasatospora sp. NPDC056138 TaxID=3345724 RepID=UPI0035E20BFC